MGFSIKLGSNCYAGFGIGISNTPQACADEWMNAYCDDQSDCLISCGGGELMCEILENMDFDKVQKAKPKWFMGYSDNTNLTYLLTTICDTAAIYGPCAAAFGMEPWHQSLQDAMSLLQGKLTHMSGYEKWEKESLKNEENPLLPYNVTEPRVLTSYYGTNKVDLTHKLSFQGRLIGGCMDCLVTLLGTRFDHTKEFIEQYKDDGFIWFLESCDLNVFGIRRAMWQMEQAEWFRYVKGFLIGRPLCYGQEMMGLNAYQAVLAVASKYQVPVVMDIDLGHLAPMMPIVVGSVGKVEVQGNHFSMEYSYE